MKYYECGDNSVFRYGDGVWHVWVLRGKTVVHFSYSGDGTDVGLIGIAEAEAKRRVTRWRMMG